VILELYFAATSPYVRKVMICAHELGLAGEIETLSSAANPILRDARIATFNPLAKVPAARLADGTVLYDSRVICEYLDHVGQGGLFPRNSDRWAVLTQQALGDGLLDAALLVRYEDTARPEALRLDAWRAGQMTKIVAALDAMEASHSAFAEKLTIGGITFASALGYLDFRFPSFDWRSGRPQISAWFAQISQRPSLQLTVPKDAPRA